MDHEITNIDELLNSFLDGELDARHQTEVQRLIKHDERIAKRLLELQKCKRLVSSLPYAEAPDKMLEDIKASLEEKKPTLPAARSVSSSAHQQRQGARHLLVRRLTAAVAMIALVAVLAAVIYSIVAPQVTITEMPVAVETKIQPREVAVAGKPAEITPFTGRLELKTGSPSEVAAFLNKAIELNVPADQRTAAVPGRSRESFTLLCSRQNLRSFLTDLGTIWDKFDSATLYIDTGQPEEQIVVDAVAPEQIIEIAKQDDFQTQIKTAKFFAAMNNIAEFSPSKEMQVAIDNIVPRLLTVPKPVLTSSEKPVTKPSAQTEDSQKIHLTITVVP
jgi:anti-sigma factor RsiW